MLPLATRLGLFLGAFAIVGAGAVYLHIKPGGTSESLSIAPSEDQCDGGDQCFTPDGSSPGKIGLILSEKAGNRELAELLTPAEIHEMQEWSASRDYTPEIRSIYGAYDDTTIMALAAQGDQYAIEEGYARQAQRGHVQLGLTMLQHAAALGSTTALISAGSWAEGELRSITENGRDPDWATELYDLYNSDLPIEQELAYIAAKHYAAATLRGNVGLSSQYLELLQKQTLGREFTPEELRRIYEGAEQLYNQLEGIRAGLGMEPFDNQYPPSYAKFYGLPEQYEAFREMLESAVP